MSPIQLLSASEKRSVAIAGAGIGGLALALALKKSGIDPVVFERKREDQLRSEGAFLTLAPNGVNALRLLGLADVTVSAGVVTRGLAMFNERGKRLGIMDYSRHETVFGAPSVTISRGALAGNLLDSARLAGIDVRFECGILGVEEDVGEVRVAVAGGTMPFNTLAACDGLRSTVRRLVFPDLPQPVYSGLIGTGGMTEAPDVPETGGLMNMTFGRKAFFGYLKAPGQPVFWFNSYPAPESEVGPIADPHAYARYLEGLHVRDPLDNRQILAAVPAVTRNYPIYDMPELAHWHTGRIVLMGDAAHAVAPHSGQGASMAIEDALVLAACLGKERTPEAAFRRFRTLRHDRTQTAIRIGRMAGSQKYARSWLEIRLRDLMLPIFLPMGARAQERFFHFRIDRDALATPHQ